jgi:type IV secretion system protein VirD4
MSDRAQDDRNDIDVAGMAAAAAALAAIAWLLPVAPSFLYSGHWPHLNVVEAITGSLRLVGDARWADPASAYPPDARPTMPGAAGWWMATGWLLLTLGFTATGVWRRFEPLVARERLGRRRYDPHGARPRPWARPRDLRTGPEGFVVGRLDGRRVATHEEAHIAVVAPTRAGKTSRCIIPWLLEHPGPVIVTSTKRDVVEATCEARRSRGSVWVYDPFDASSAGWSPLAGCSDWSFALRQAQWLADATQEGYSEIARYWRGEAAKFLAPLLHAAALGQRPIGDVISWLDRQKMDDANVHLLAKNAEAAARQLSAIEKLDERNRGTTYMSAGSVLAAYRFPEVLASARPDLTAPGFLDGTEQTLYVVAPERHQRLLAPLVVALLSSMINAALERPVDQGAPRLRVLLDEAANIAPLTELPRMLAQGAGHGIRFATVWQSLGQLRERYGHGADSILANSTAKLFMGSITDQATRAYARDLLGEDRSSHDPTQRGRPRASAPALQQLERDRGLLIEGDLPPMLVALRPWWQRRIAS